jgi:zinc protease
MKKQITLLLWVGILCGLSAQQAMSQQAAPAQQTQQKELPAPKKITSVEGITEYQLDNGLRVLLFPDESKQTITVNITYLVGSKHENYGETGMAHLLEHLVFKGTPKHPNIPQELTERGARPNGTTWTDRTNYFETFNATEDNLRWALDLESDRMVNSFIAKEDLDSEMTVVRNEFESGENSPFRVLMQRTMSAAYDWHNYGKSTIGARSDIENVDIDRLQAFYKKYYQHDNAVLVVAGKFDEEKTLALVNEGTSGGRRIWLSSSSQLWLRLLCRSYGPHGNISQLTWPHTACQRASNFRLRLISEHCWASLNMIRLFGSGACSRS